MHYNFILKSASCNYECELKKVSITSLDLDPGHTYADIFFSTFWPPVSLHFGSLKVKVFYFVFFQKQLQCWGNFYTQLHSEQERFMFEIIDISAKLSIPITVLYALGMCQDSAMTLIMAADQVSNLWSVMSYLQFHFALFYFYCYYYTLMRKCQNMIRTMLLLNPTTSPSKQHIQICFQV